MLIKKLKRDGWETVDMICKNGSTSQILAGTWVAWDIASAKDGSIALPATATLRTMAGVAIENIGTSGQPDDVKRVRAFGWYGSAFLAGTTVHPGAMLVPANGASYLTLATSHGDSTAETPTELYKCAIAGTTGCLIATSTFSTAYTYPVFVRCL
jgi:hypothetical protein